MLPYVIPPIALVAGIIVDQAARPLVPQLRLSLIPFYAVLALPFTFRSLDAGIRAIDVKTLVDASRSLGAGWGTTLRRALIPNLRTAIISSSFLTATVVLGEFTIASVLLSARCRRSWPSYQTEQRPGRHRPRAARARRHHRAASPCSPSSPASAAQPAPHIRLLDRIRTSMSALAFISVRKTFGPTVALESLDLDVAQRRADQPARTVGLRQDHGAAHRRRVRVRRLRRGRRSAAPTSPARRPTSATWAWCSRATACSPTSPSRSNVDFGLRTRKIAAAERKQRVGEMLELVQLSSMAKRYPHQLSGGQQQRVALARALAIRPEVLLLDEPLSALDAKVRLALRDEIRRIQTELGITTLFVTHDQEEALGIADRVGVMSNGRLEQLAAPSEVYSKPSSAFVARFVGSMNELPATVRGADAVEVAGNVDR